MDARNCRRCKKLFAYRNKPICPDCEKQEELDFEKVRDFVKENPGSSIPVITEETGVPGNMIMRFLKESRLDVVEGMPPLLTCEVCFAPIHLGRFCKNCSQKISKRVGNSIAPKPVLKTEAKRDATMHLSKFKGDN